MVVEHIVKRTVYVSKCPQCGDESIKDANPPRERKCSCGGWVPYVEQSAISQEYKALRG